MAQGFIQVSAALALTCLLACAPPAFYVPIAPPTARVEARPKAPGPRHAWVPGRWSWSVGRDVWIWVPGLWSEMPPRAKAFSAGKWVRKGTMWVWRGGHWIY